MSSTNKTKKRILQYSTGVLIFIALAWTALTIYVEMPGPPKEWSFGDNRYKKKALILFDPDPFYNLDEQVCISIAKALSGSGVAAHIATVSAAENVRTSDYDIIVYCANTYNWRPDWAITDFIETNRSKSKVAAITLGAGSTSAAQKHLEKIITESGNELLASHALWLWRPNDESKMEDVNVTVAVNMAYVWGIEIADEIR